MVDTKLIKNYLSLGSHKAFGVDFTNDSLKVFQLESRGSGSKVTGWNRKEMTKGIVDYYEIKDAAKFSDLFLSTLKEAKGRITGKNVVIALPENKVFTRIISMPLMQDKEAGEAIKYEAESNIPVSIDEVYFDWQIVEKGTDSMKVLIMAAPKRVVDNYISTFESLGYDVVAVEAESVATGRSVIKKDDKGSIVILDIGADSTSYAIYQDGYPVFTSSGSVSGKLFTDTIAKHMGITLEQAETYKVKVGLGEAEAKEKNIHTALTPLISTLVMELERTLSFFEEKLDNSKKDKEGIGKILLCGGGSNLKGLMSYLAFNLKTEVVQSSPWENINLGRNTPPISQTLSQSFATVIGLAIRAQQYEDYD